MHHIGKKLILTAAEADRIKTCVTIEDGTWSAWVMIGEAVLGRMVGSGLPFDFAALVYHHGRKDFMNSGAIHMSDDPRHCTRTVFLEPGSVVEAVVGPLPACSCGRCP